METVPATWRRSPVDQHVRPGEIPPEAVRIADGHEPDPRRPLGDEAAPRVGALTGVEKLHLRQLAVPRKRGLEAVLAGSVPNGESP